jgi:Zn-dependent protease
VSFLEIVLQLGIFFFSIIIHEVAHGYTALIKGDPTAKESGRLTLSPLPHIDIVGSIILPLLLIFTRSSVIFGWAKPVPINPFYLKNPKRDFMWIGLAGPLSNIGIAVIFSIIIRMGITGEFVIYGVTINLLLAFFNLLPIPPLDGSRVLQGFLPYEWEEKYMQIERFGFLIIFFLLWTGLLHLVLIPLMRVSFKVLTGLPS